jgi:hypothetical protein
MNKRMSLIVIVTFFLALPLSAAGMSHQKHEHGSKHEGHAGMKMEEGMAMLGDQTVEDIKAMAHLNDVKDAMAKVGMKETHHIMVAFVDTKTGTQVIEGTVAVKIVDPAGKESDAIRLEGMEGHFGADIVLPEKGKYVFKVGTKLPDGKTRQYEFSYTLK